MSENSNKHQIHIKTGVISKVSGLFLDYCIYSDFFNGITDCNQTHLSDNRHLVR